MKTMANPATSETMPAAIGGAPSVCWPQPHFRWPAIDAEEQRAVAEVLGRGELSLHRDTGIVRQFEDAFATMHGLPHAMSTSSGTSALHAAYFGLNLMPGDEVLVPAYTHLGTVLPMLHANLVPVLCDIDLTTGNIDPKEIATRASARTRAVMVTHQYGHVCAMHDICEQARSRDMFVLEDCSHAHGAKFLGRLAGTFGDVACFSLQAHKAVVAGEGGILVTRDPHIFERAALLGHFRQPRPTTTDESAPFVCGRNSKCTQRARILHEHITSRAFQLVHGVFNQSSPIATFRDHSNRG